MFYDGNDLVAHYKLWYENYREAIEEKLEAATKEDDPQKALRDTAETILTVIIPIAIAEMILYNNKKLEERLNTDEDGGCMSCASNLKA